MQKSKNDIEMKNGQSYWLTYSIPNRGSFRVRVYISETGDHIAVDTDIHQADGATVEAESFSRDYDRFRTESSNNWIRLDPDKMDGITVATHLTLFKSLTHE